MEQVYHDARRCACPGDGGALDGGVRGGLRRHAAAGDRALRARGGGAAAPDPVEQARGGPGHPRILPAPALWAGLLVCVLRGFGSQQALHSGPAPRDGPRVARPGPAAADQRDLERPLRHRPTRRALRIATGGVSACPCAGRRWIVRATSSPSTTRPNAAKPCPSGLRAPP